MKFFLLVVGIVVLGFVYIGYPLYRAGKIGNELKTRTTAYEQHPDNPNMRILIAGDSIGVGVGAADQGDSLAGRLGATYPTADITNISESGLRMQGLSQKLHAHRGTSYDLVLITIGANDVTHYTSSAIIEAELVALLEWTAAHANNTIVLTAGNIGLAPVFRFPYSLLVTGRTRAVRAIFMETIEKYPSASYVDLFRTREEDIFRTDIAKYYAADYFHPSGAGYGVWYEDIEPLVR